MQTPLPQPSQFLYGYQAGFQQQPQPETATSEFMRGYQAGLFDKLQHNEYRPPGSCKSKLPLPAKIQSVLIVLLIINFAIKLIETIH